MTRQEFVEKCVIASFGSPFPDSLRTTIGMAIEAYDMLPIDDPKPEKPATHWVSFAERAPSREDADERGNVGFMSCAEHADGMRLLEFYWDAFHESRNCPNCYWCRLPGVKA